MINDDVSCLPNDYELRKLMLEQMDIKDLRSIVFNKKKEAKEVRVLDEHKTWIDFLSKSYSMDYMFVHNTFLEVLREPMNEVIDIMEREIKRRTYNWDQTDLNELKARVSISDVVSHYIPAYWSMRKWSNIKCPFHNDWTASLHVYERTNTFKCFWCQAGGTSIDFIMKSEQCSLREAIERLKSF